MPQKMLITKVVRTTECRAELYGKGHRFRDLMLFDLSYLLDVGIDPAGLQVGAESPCRFWAIYELSEKLKQAGNPYKDIVAVEPTDRPASSTSTDTTALQQELRAIRALLTMMTGKPAPVNEPETEPPTRTDDNGQLVSENVAEIEACTAYLTANSAAPGSVESLRQWVLAGNGPQQTENADHTP